MEEGMRGGADDGGHEAFGLAAEQAWPRASALARIFLGAVARHGLPPLPERLAAAAGLGAGPPEGAEAWGSLGRAFALALAEYPPDPGDWEILRVPEMLSYVDGNVRHGLQAERRARLCSLVPDLGRVLAEARAEGAAWRWHERIPHRHEAVIGMGRLRFLVSFSRQASGTWHQGWMGIGETGELLNHLDREARLGRPVRTGLFPHLDAAVGAVIRAFLEEVGPDGLRVDGLDAVRNAHNLRSYAAHAPDGYALEPIRDAGTLRATRDGVTGVRFVRLPEPAPGPGGP